MEKKLGKIASVYFGHGGYQDAMLGIHFSLSFTGSGCGDSNASWDAGLIPCSQHSKWTEVDRDVSYANIMRFVSKLLNEAKVDRVDKLKDIPIEATFDGNMLKEWRILTEVI